MSAEQYHLIVAHCLDGLPDEACGMLVGPMEDLEPTGVVTAVHPSRNAAASARTYKVEPDDVRRAMSDAYRRGEELVGVWHSHTHTDAYPSSTDVREARDPSWIYAIVSLRHGEPALRAYRIRDGVIDEIDIVVR